MTTSALRRRLGLLDAITIGMSSMLGAGVFVAFAPAAGAAGPALLLALGVAAVVAYCNAAASAQLAALYPESGGTYIYGRERLGRWAGFVAGWCFISGKLASCAAMALAFGLYLAPGYAKALAVAAVVVLTVLNILGVRRTALVSRILLALTLITLAVVAVLCFSGPGFDGSGLSSSAALSGDAAPPWAALIPGLGIFQAAGFLFFAFAGYARIATMGEEVRNPQRIIPAAIFIALAATLGIYLLLASGLLRALGPLGLAESATPLLEIGQQAGWGPLIVVGASAASLGALLALIAGVSRTSLAMARHRDLPSPLAAVGGRFGTPHRAEIAVALLVIVLILTTDVLTIVGYSSCGVLIYYGVTNLSALTLSERRWHTPRAINLLGCVGCLILAFTLPTQSVVWMIVLLTLGCLARASVLSWRTKVRKK
ncbi:APC family permease [Psychromicrobium xiongbiense]|uniref:APC family permease n=1 Tax=Psychromicrobium xiongbiense TaxID=3051184 RepID=UPI0025541680|nr:APC family permease [Psychromicrobium sp. YIM S02556]